MTGDINRMVTRRIGAIGAFLLISASASLGAFYGYTVGSHTHWSIGLVFAGAALGGEILKPNAVALAMHAARAREFARAIACTALAAVCIIYSFSAELSLAAASRGDYAAEREQKSETLSGWRDRRGRAQAELQALQPARSAAELDPLIATLKATRGANGCEGRVRGATGQEACAKGLLLASEVGRAQRREELKAEIVAADRALSVAVPVAANADPLASAVSVYARATGRDWRPESVAPWLTLIPVLFLEVGSALSLAALGFVGGGHRADTSTRLTPPSHGQRATGANEAREPSTVQTMQAPAHGASDAIHKDVPAPDTQLSARVTELLHRHGGRIESGQRALGRALGISKSRLNEILHEMAQAGSIAVETSRTGTTIALA